MSTKKLIVRPDPTKLLRFSLVDSTPNTVEKCRMECLGGWPCECLSVDGSVWVRLGFCRFSWVLFLAVLSFLSARCSGLFPLFCFCLGEAVCLPYLRGRAGVTAWFVFRLPDPRNQLLGRTSNRSRYAFLARFCSSRMLMVGWPLGCLVTTYSSSTFLKAASLSIERKQERLAYSQRNDSGQIPAWSSASK